jgi:cytochrome c oxidase subunit 2
MHMESIGMQRKARQKNGKAAALAAVFVMALAGTAGAAPSPEPGYGLPRDVSEFGHHIDWLIEVTGVFTAILFVIMVVWMVWACLQHNEKHEAEYDHGASKHSIKTAVLLSAVIFFVVDGNLFYNSTTDVFRMFWNHDSVENNPQAVKIEVNAHQWAWDARYAGPDGKFNTSDDIITLNDIRVPVGVPVLLQLVSPDVIHSFYLPNLRIKQDAMPGMTNRMWFQAKQTGEFEIGCAQHCGVNHYKMKGTLTVLSPEEYKTWATEQSAIGARGYDPKDLEAHWGWEWRARN